MATYRRGSKGREVERIQARLKELGLYLGPVDGDFGGGTESAVRGFQRSASLDIDGDVGPITWARLFPGEATTPVPELVGRPIAFRVIALTGTFETSTHPPDCFACVTGDFDGQGVSYGALQWNFGQGSLQPLLTRMDQLHHQVLVDLFDDHYPVLRAVLDAPRDEQLAWSRSIQDARHRLIEPWSGLLKALGRRDEFQRIQVEAAQRMHQDALGLCNAYDVRTERAFALMFDIRVQNGSISPLVRAQIEQDFLRLGSGAPEVERLRVIANRRAEAANPRWIEDVRARKLTIANGEGTVHGRHYHLEEQYGLGLKPATF